MLLSVKTRGIVQRGKANPSSARLQQRTANTSQFILSPVLAEEEDFTDELSVSDSALVHRKAQRRLRAPQLPAVS